MKNLPSHFIWLDALRGVAALVVVIFHYHHFYMDTYLDRANIPSTDQFPYAEFLFPAYDYGFRAVELFWVISGFVFAHVYTNRRATWSDFVVARFARLYPLHFVTLLFVLAVQLLSMEFLGNWQVYGNNDAKHFFLQLAFASNWITWSDGLSFNGPVWSVSLEILVYFLFFASLPTVKRAGLIASVTMSCCVFVVYYSDMRLPLVRLEVFRCAGYFFAGVSVYLWIAKFGYGLKSMALPLGISLLLVAIGVLGAASSSDNMLLLGIFIPTLLAVTYLDVLFGSKVNWLKPLGDLSYSIYLVHVPIQMVVLLVVRISFGENGSFADKWFVLPTYILASVSVAWLVFRYFEMPVGSYLRAVLQRRDL